MVKSVEQKKIDLLWRRNPLRIFMVGVLCTAVLFSLLASFALSALNPLLGMVAAIILLCLTVVLFKRHGVANGTADFIDLENNTLFVIEAGVWRFVHRKIPFQKISHLRCVTVSSLSRYIPRKFRIYATIDGQEVLFVDTNYRRHFNESLENLAKHFDVSVRFEREPSYALSTDYSFENSLYNYEATPGTYLYWLSVYFLASLVMLLFAHNSWLTAFLVIFTIFHLKRYRGAKAELLKLSQRS